MALTDNAMCIARTRFVSTHEERDKRSDRSECDGDDV